MRSAASHRSSAAFRWCSASISPASSRRRAGPTSLPATNGPHRPRPQRNPLRRVCREGAGHGDWLAELPAGLTRAEAMASAPRVYAMLALMAIERAGVEPSSGPALVTGAGGVGSMATSLLAGKGWASSPRPGGWPRLTISNRLARPKSSTARRSAPRQAVRQGTLGGGGRQRRLGDARQRAGADEVRRRGSGLRTCGGMELPATIARSSSAAYRYSGSRASTARRRAGSRRGGCSPPTSTAPSSRR